MQLEHAIGAAYEGRIVGRHDGRHAAGVHELADELHDGCSGAAVELAGGFVGEEQLRARGEGASDPDPLLLPARELVRALCGVGAETHELE